MVRKVCLDSDVIINLLQKDKEMHEIISSLDADFYTTCINSFEIWYGRKKSEHIFTLLEWLHILDMEDRAARLAADMLRDLKKKGKIIELRDVFTAAICITHNIELLTCNKKHFARLQRFGLMLVA